MVKGTVEKIYSEYKSQIDTIAEIKENNYNKTAKIVAWLYGGSSERWRHILSAGKKQKPPKEIQEFLRKLKKK